MTSEIQCSCYAIITDPIRKGRFSGIFPDDQVPIKGPLANNALAETGDELYQFYELDKSRISPEQRQRLIERLAPTFDVSRETVEQAFEDPKVKIPLRADHVVVTWCEHHARLAP